jgi:hypothetical protein
MKSHDIFVRAHTVTAEKKKKKRKNQDDGPKWPVRVLVLDTETTTDTWQQLTFGAYRLCELIGGKYVCSEEGLFYADRLGPRQFGVLQSYVATQLADIEVKSFPPKLNLELYSRSEFLEQVFWKAIKNRTMIVGFNLPFDLSRMSVDWRTGYNDSWSLILSLWRSRKTGKLEPNPHRPRIRLRSKDSQSAFIAMTRPQNPEEWPRGRFLDLHTLAFALFGETLGLDDLCNKLGIPGKIKHEPTGQVTASEINYCRRDVRATTGVLNELKQEFDTHPLDLHPDRAYSPASMAKAYLDAMGILPPRMKFKVSNRMLGIAMQAYYGGRAECRIRHTPVPIVHTDFKSQYPMVNTLLGNWNILTAKSVSFDDVTDEVCKLLAAITLKDTFDPDFWKKLGFFVLVKSNQDILPVRTVYNGETQNIGVNALSSDRPIWFAGPDVIASVLLTGKVPRIEKAIRMVPHGRQVGLKTTSLRGMVSIDPRKHNFFRHVVEQRELHERDGTLASFLKVVGNSGSYGSFVEITPEKLPKPVQIKVFSGEDSFEPSQTEIIEQQGRWYFPPLAALITAGGRLLLAMLERCVTDAGGSYLFCDTDSLCIVASEDGGLVACPGGLHILPDGSEAVKALSWKEVQSIANEFKTLNPYDPAIVPDLLKIEKINFDSTGHQRQLTGYSISAKRYVLYQQTGNDLSVVEPKAHGLGYLYPPIENKGENEAGWVFEAWDFMLRQGLELQPIAPAWLDIPAMMRIVVSTPHVLGRLKYLTRPYNFLFCPLIDRVGGYPANVDPNNFTPITAFTRDRGRWSCAKCINVHDGKVYRIALRQSDELDRLIPQTFGYILNLYFRHRESKSLAPDGTPCQASTRGLLKRASIVAGRLRYVGKETDRRWEPGEDLSLFTFKPIEYVPSGKVIADQELRDEIAKRGMRELMRLTGLSQHTIEAIRKRKAVRRATLQRIQSAVGRDTPPLRNCRLS